MIFNSFEFGLFLPIVFCIYWLLSRYKLGYQNVFLLASSYFFYGWWDYKFLILIFISSLADYSIGLGFAQTSTSGKRRLLLGLSIIVNLGFLIYFKYANFFIESFADAFTFFGQSIDEARLNIVLPVGISFYTFQTLSYSIDVYRRKLKPSKNIISFFAYVSFFPQLVAGPIERAINLLPQFETKRKFDYGQSVDGMRQILWGLFKKVVIADNCALFVNDVFANYPSYSGLTLCIGAMFFAFQIYCDFSGYSDIAIGTSRLFGFSLMKNFAFPYFSRDIAEFWRRWHISLSTWFRDYLYIPLGGSRGGLSNKIRNTFIIFIVSGFWHGANWTFIIWGFLNALYFLPLLLSNKNRVHTDVVAEGSLVPSISELYKMLTTFFITCIAWIFFRADSVSTAFSYIKRLVTSWGFTMEHNYPKPTIIILLILFMVVEWIQREQEHGLALTNAEGKRLYRWLLYSSVVLLIYIFQGEGQDFIYFQF